MDYWASPCLFLSYQAFKYSKARPRFAVDSPFPRLIELQRLPLTAE